MDAMWKELREIQAKLKLADYPKKGRRCSILWQNADIFNVNKSFHFDSSGEFRHHETVEIETRKPKLDFQMKVFSVDRLVRRVPIRFDVFLF